VHDIETQTSQRLELKQVVLSASDRRVHEVECKSPIQIVSIVPGKEPSLTDSQSVEVLRISDHQPQEVSVKNLNKALILQLHELGMQQFR
jgi:hypothetical protein